MKRIVLAAAAFVASACAMVPRPVDTRPFGTPLPSIAGHPAEYAPFMAGGGGEVTGHAFMRTRGGDIKLAAGNEVRLDPITTYSRAWFAGRGQQVRYFGTDVSDLLFSAARREKIVDAQGKFTFGGLAAGWYYVTTKLQWETGGAYTPTQGGVLADSVLVRAPQSAETIFSR